VRQGQNYHDVKIEAWKDSQEAADIELLPIESLGLLILPHTQRVDEKSTQHEKDADTQGSIAYEKACRRKKFGQCVPSVLQENCRNSYATQPVQARNSPGQYWS
jgi:hypothetical protein